MFEQCIKAKSIMNKFGYPWFVVGGWAVDLFLSEETRIHSDFEIGIYRKHQMQLYRYFESSIKYFINNKSRIGKHEKKEWNKEYLQLPIHEIYIEYKGAEIEVLLNERDDNNWVYRRNCAIKLDEKKAILSTGKRIPYLCPEAVLLYKTQELREKDCEDIKNAARKMNEKQIQWLFDNIKDQAVKEKVSCLIKASTLMESRRRL